MTLRMNIAPIPELQFADKAAALPFLTSIAEGFASSCADGTFDDLLTTNVTALALQNVTTAVSVMERDFLVTPVWLATFCAYAQCPIWGPIAWIAGTVMALVIAIVLTPTLVCGAKQHDSMAFFTRGYIQSMDERFPGNNFLVWHNSQNGQLGIEHFERNTHAHYELDVPCAGTEGYELHSFYRGNFTRSGAGGYINWAFGGNWKRGGRHGEEENFVEFFPREEPFVYISDPDELHRRDIYGKGESKLPAWNSTLAQKGSSWVHPGTGSQLSVLRDVVARGNETLPERAPRPAANILRSSEEQQQPNDGAYFVHCNSTDDALASSGVAYYRSLKPGANVGQLPDDFVWVAQNHSPSFAKSTGAVEFLGGATGLHWSIMGSFSDHMRPLGELTGFANDGIDHFFMYTDAGQELFSTTQYSCYSEYYAF